MEKIIEYVKRARVGDNEAIKELYNLTIHTSYFMARKFIKDEQDANDVVQDAYITAFKKISQLEDDSKFPNWLNRIVANKAKDYLKKKKPTVFSNITSEEQNVEEFLEDETIEFKPKDQYEYEELKNAMSDIIDNLSEENRMCILMYYFQGLSVGEIADTLELSSGTIKSRLNYGRKHIKKEVETLEAKGVKFRGVAPIPFMVWMFKQYADQTAIPASISNAVLSTSASNLATTTVTVFGKTISKSLFTKIVAGLVVTSVVATGTVVAVMNSGESAPNTEVGNDTDIQEETTQYSQVSKSAVQFDSAPVAVDGKGYIVEVDGKYGFIGSDQSYIVEAKFDNVSRYGFEKEEMVCFTSLNDSSNLKGEPCGNGLGGTTPFRFAWDESLDKAIIMDSTNVGNPQEIIQIEYNGEIDFLGIDELPSGYQFYDMKDYLTSELEQIDYSLSESELKEQMIEIEKNRKVYIVKDGLKVDETQYDQAYVLYPQMTNDYSITRNRPISQLNAIRKGNKWALLDKDLNKISDFEYENLKPISNTSTYVEKDGYIGIIDEKGKLVLLGDFEEVSAPIDGKAYVKTNGEWIQIEIK